MSTSRPLIAELGRLVRLSGLPVLRKDLQSPRTGKPISEGSLANERGKLEGCAASTDIPFPGPDPRTSYRQWMAMALLR